MAGASMPKTERLPEIIVFAGPNGSGKSTVTRIAKVVQPYINADDIKTALNCSDLEAAQVAEKMRNAQVDAGEGFTFETVLSTSRNLELLKRAKAKGFFIRCIYILTASPDINVIRVKAREAAGGHGVPEDKVCSRYERALALIPELVSVCDICHIYDNSERPFRIFKKRKERCYFFKKCFLAQTRYYCPYKGQRHSPVSFSVKSIHMHINPQTAAHQHVAACFSYMFSLSVAQKRSRSFP